MDNIDIQKKFRFRQFKVYQDAMTHYQEIKKITEHFPATEKFVLTQQLLRALISIILNIAEGSDRGTDKDFALFLNRAHTSLNEVVACLDIAYVSNYLAIDEYNVFLQKLSLLANQLTAFRKKLLTNPIK